MQTHFKNIDAKKENPDVHEVPLQPQSESDLMMGLISADEFVPGGLLSIPSLSENQHGKLIDPVPGPPHLEIVA